MAKTTSSFFRPGAFRLSLRGPSGAVLGGWEAPYDGSRCAEALQIDGRAPFALVLERSGEEAPALSLHLGAELVEEVAEGARGRAEMARHLSGQAGLSELVVRRGQSVLLRVPLRVVAGPRTLRHLQAMIEELEAIHTGLAQDVLGKVFERRGLGQGAAPQALNPALLLPRLAQIAERIERAVRSIARQPSQHLAAERSVGPYRPGDRLPPAALAHLAGGGSPQRLPRESVRLSTDLPEHRHIARRLRHLVALARAIEHHCRQSAELLAADEARWGGWSGSVFERLGLPRMELLGRQQAQAAELARTLLALVTRTPFLASAGEPRTPLTLTPLFAGRPAYTEAYRALLQAAELFGGLIDGEGLRLYYRELPSLYEYWSFVKTVQCLRSRFGPPVGQQQTFSLIDEVYRPCLQPGQFFEFAAEAARIRVSYEPDILPFEDARRRGQRWGAAMVRAPLRPDIVVEVEREGEPPTALVLDAKSTSSFAEEKLWQLRDYARLVFEVESGQQPIRQVFLLHRDGRAGLLANAPGYFSRPSPSGDTRHLLGAAALVPGEGVPGLEGLQSVLERFFEGCGLPGNLDLQTATATLGVAVG